MAELIITNDNFEEEVVKSDRPVLLDFWAAWCGPCKMLSPVIAQLAEKYEGKVKVGKINVDQEIELAAAFHVSSIPMIVVMKNGMVTAKSVGYMPIDKVEALLQK
ncbi:MAG: thioredoxin [Clostridia bacterium]|nr:thioredoxin [Clostridia bacterium]